MSTLKDSWLLFLNGHVDLVKTISDTSQASLSYFNENVYETIEDTYQTTLDFMTECLEELDPPIGLNQSTSSLTARPGPSEFSLAHLPPINLPPFDGNYDQWEHFRDRFTALIISNKDLRNFARMHYLVSCLKDNALECIKDLAVTADNFDVAWKALHARYENKRRLLGVHLSALLGLPSVSRDSASNLQAVLDKVNSALTSLTNLQRTPADLWNDMLGHLICQKLDSATRKAWSLKTSDSEGLPSVDELLQFLRHRIRALEEFSMQPANKSSSKSPVRKVTAATASASASGSSPAPCPVCKARHYFNACPSFVKGSPSQRRELVRVHKRCFNCLSSSHAVRECSSKYSCRTCKQRHHTMLHMSSDGGSTSPATSVPAAAEAAAPVEAQSTVTSLLSSTVDEHAPVPVLLATAWISASGPSGRSVRVRALLDQGSEMTFISEKVAQILCLKRFRLPVSVSAVGGVHAGTFHFAAEIHVSPVTSRSPMLTATALIMKKLTSYAPRRVAEISSLDHLRQLTWADENPASSDPIDVILGADVYSSLLLDGIRKGTPGQPIAQNSVFGWVISGPVSDVRTAPTSSSASPPRSSLHISVNHCCHSLSLENELQKFWEIEEPPRRYVPSADEERCESHFRETHSRAADGRFIVRLPFKREIPLDIGDSKFKARKLLESLLRRLKTQPDHESDYRGFLEEYERLGHMRPAPCSSDPRAQCVFIPHHAVFRADSATSRIRVVFNASSLTSNGKSLNDHLLAGPKLQSDLPTIILKWRNFQFVCTADIAKMYRQIRVDDRDLDFQRILWQPATSDSAVEYQLLTVTYGTACAPYLALRVVKQLALDDGAEFPSAAEILQHHTYVDDVLFGDDDAMKLRQTRDQLIKLLRRGGFELRKWASNSHHLLADIDPSDHGLACTSLLSPDEKLKILGLGWHPALDSFHFKVSLNSVIPISKRSILSAIAKLYDPVGWVTPVIITAKILIQRLWQLKVTWDESVPPAVLSRWTQIYSRLPCLNQLKIPRWTGLGSETLHAELHGFADASSEAFAAAVYLRAVSLSGNVTISLLVGKSKVAPLKLLSIPRLELSAAVLLSQLIDFVQGSVEFKTLPCVCWTDSTIVLAWLQQPPSRWKTFVANRVADIQARVPDVTWRHIATEDNPADCASRGLLGDEILAHPLWWHGPPWLRLAHNQWPNTSLNLPASAPLEERIIAANISTSIEPFELASRYSSWPKLIRVTAYVIRFVSLCRRLKRDASDEPSTGSALSASDCRAAKTFWIKYIQAEVFPKELQSLAANQPIPAKSSLLSLNPVLDRDGIIRVGGRLRHAPQPVSVRHPILLASHSLVRLIVAHAHIRSLHAGLQLTLSTVRRDYWILRARSIAKMTLHKCVVCTRERAATPTQLMGNLPAVRISAPKRCFLHCGLDYAGPVLVRASGGRGIKARKAYIALFVCLATRAIHLELVSDYSTPAFLDAFSRFCARRGLPNAIYSDNGTTFVGANRELETAYRAALRDPSFQNRTATDDISWHFMPPSAPHFGGMWEAGVKSVKHHLRRVLGAHTLTFEELSTLLCRIEACLNSRPIAPLSDDITDCNALTPGHFLIGSPITVNPEESTVALNENRLTRWQLIRHVTERLWRLWYTDYVNTLQQRSKWRRAQPSIKIGQLVLLQNATLPPCKWELGRVTQCYPGADGLTRVVSVKTASSEYKRPIAKLCLLPVDSESLAS